ncbi:MAG: SUMF1/EgtB/PvdO family nonheme iron enzyme [Polyangiaceae bacterium]|nr:SUMF1/EgtB/PvdO family nonheme iron enzyme [Polyangiaceae bacterium]
MPHTRRASPLVDPPAWLERFGWSRRPIGVLGGLACVAACSAGAAGTVGGAGSERAPSIVGAGRPSGEPRPGVVGGPTGEGVPARPSEADAGAARGAAAPCPPEMTLIAGEACAGVERDCVRNWYDATLRRRVCVEYRGPARCDQPRPARLCIDAREATAPADDAGAAPDGSTAVREAPASPGAAGTWPVTGVSVFEAQVACASRGARLCTAPEWALACEGPERLPFPYGLVRDAGRCNVDRVARGPAPSDDEGAALRARALLVPVERAGCGSASGVEALAGNAAELVALERETSAGGIAARAGGLPLLGEQNGCRTLAPVGDLERSALVGFRCCAEADGRPTDPRTPLQRARGWSFSRVERLAGRRAHAPPPPR